jgi:hypothetical protein
MRELREIPNNTRVDIVMFQEVIPGRFEVPLIWRIPDVLVGSALYRKLRDHSSKGERMVGWFPIPAMPDAKEFAKSS